MKRSQTSVLLTVLMAISLVVSACGGGSSTRGATSATPTTSPTSATQVSPAWSAVLSQLGPNGEDSLSTALQAYTLAIGPLPGVQAPANTGGHIPLGTLAVRMVLEHYHDLTSAQQQAVLQRLDLKSPASAKVSSSGAVGVAAAAQTLARPGLQPLVVPSLPVDAPGTAAYRTMITDFIPKYNGFLKMAYTLPIVLYWAPTPVQGNADAYTYAVNAQGSYTGSPPALCRIYFNPALPSSPLDYQQLVVAHELFHCYQAAI